MRKAPSEIAFLWLFSVAGTTRWVMAGIFPGSSNILHEFPLNTNIPVFPLSSRTTHESLMIYIPPANINRRNIMLCIVYTDAEKIIFFVKEHRELSNIQGIFLDG